MTTPESEAEIRKRHAEQERIRKNWSLKVESRGWAESRTETEIHEAHVDRDTLLRIIDEMRRTQAAAPRVEQARADLAMEACEALLTSLGEYIRQSMALNPEWRAGIEAVRAAMGPHPPSALLWLERNARQVAENALEETQEKLKHVEDILERHQPIIERWSQLDDDFQAWRNDLEANLTVERTRVDELEALVEDCARWAEDSKMLSRQTGQEVAYVLRGKLAALVQARKPPPGTICYDCADGERHDVCDYAPAMVEKETPKFVPWRCWVCAFLNNVDGPDARQGWCQSTRCSELRTGGPERDRKPEGSGNPG
jgi:DNA repair exonuclease SbcCD ATPase subunit